MSPIHAIPERVANSGIDGVRMRRRATVWRRRNSRPRIELLEERTLLSIDMVSNSNDSGAGSLRNAIANAGAGDTIEFNMSLGQVTSPIVLTSGPLDLAQNIKIVGPGPDELTISGGNSSAVFGVASGVNATISGLTVADGLNGGNGGGLISSGDVKLTNDVFSDNSAVSGGAICAQSGSLSMTGCTVSDNTTPTGDAGGILIVAGAVTIESSTFVGNQAAVAAGGIENVGGTLSVVNSTISGNTAQVGGGIENLDAATVINCTIAGNTASSLGGGIINSTMATLSLGNTIVAGNTASGSGPDYHGPVTTDLGSNLIGDTSTSSGLTQPSDLLNVSPDLATLENNGGPTQTMGLTPGSPAIDAGNDSILPPGDAADQRGFARIANGTVDIGAFEAQTFLVYDTADHGAGSLRTAITNADLAGGSTIVFVTSGTIGLLSTLPPISSDVYITGPGANNLTISGGGSYQVFDIENGVTADISGLTITDGYAGNGGAIENLGTLALTDCTVSDSTSSGDGGGIDNQGTLTLTASTVSGNTSSNDAGGIKNDGALTLVNSTIANNSAPAGVGGGISNNGSLTAINSTIAYNSAFNGGGINQGGSATLANTIVGDNSLTGGTGTDFLAQSPPIRETT